MRRLVGFGSVFLAVLGVLVAAVVASAAPAPQGGPTLQVVAALGDRVVRNNEFTPATVRVVEGTTITWRVGSDEEHTVAFLAGTQGSLERTIRQPEDPTGRPPMANPLVWDAVPVQGPYDGSYLVNSGPLSRDQTWSVTFGKAGTYAYLCTLHPRTMLGTVEVVAAGSSGVTTQQQVDEATAAQRARVEERVASLMAQRNRANRIDGPLGTDIWFVRAGTNWREEGHLDLDAFLPDALTIQQGDTIVWATDHLVPHTVTFLAAGQPRPEIWAAALPDGTMITTGMAPPEPSVKPRLVSINRDAVRPSATYDGMSYYSSGQIGGDSPSPRGIAWALTFTTPGTFEYVCLLHDAHGMTGQITVAPR